MVWLLIRLSCDVGGIAPGRESSGWFNSQSLRWISFKLDSHFSLDLQPKMR
jgi:hypothetical protein